MKLFSVTPILNLYSQFTVLYYAAEYQQKKGKSQNGKTTI